MATQRDFIINRIIADLALSDSTAKKHADKQTWGSPFACNTQQDAQVNVYVRRDPDVDAFAHVTIDFSTPGEWTYGVWTTSSDPTRVASETHSFTRPSGGIADVVKAVRAVAKEWLHVDGGVKAMTDADLSTIAQSSVGDA